MLPIGFFLLIAKYSRSKFEGEGKSGRERRGEGLQRGAKLLGKEKEIRREKGVSDKEKYRFQDSGIGDSWLIGDDSTYNGNAYVNYLNGCEETLIIPRELTDNSGNTKKVEVIGQYAINGCGNRLAANGITRSIVLSRYVKVIKTYGIGSMDDVTSFEIEEESCLESIDSHGLSWMGYANKNENVRRSIMVLPSTVTSIAADGLLYNNLFKTIYYCGSTHLSNYSDLVRGVSAPNIKVTRSYTYDSIFRDYTPKNDSSSIVDAEEKCCNFGYDPTGNYTSVPVKGGRMVTGWSDGNSQCPPSIDIPVKLEGATVVAVNDSAFSGCNRSKAVSLPRYLERVGREAFAGCGTNTNAGFVLTVPSGANLLDGSFSGTNVELVVC